VDAIYAPVVFRVQTYGLTLGADAAAYVQRMLSLPSMRRWYDEALAEPWRDAPHDDEVASVGTVTADLRSA
jgi:glutathione S-transferase